MKKLYIHTILFFVTSLSLLPTLTFSQTAENGQVLITGSRFTYPLLEKWISDFKLQHPDILVRILPRGSASEDSANLIINAHKLQPNEIRPNYTVVNIERYAILPIANSKNPLLKDFSINGIKENRLKEFYFQEYDAFHQETKTKKKFKDRNEYKPNLYTREQKACAPTAFANFYNLQQQNIKGKGISGEDKHLIPVVKKDTNGLTYNVLNWIYDLKTREISPGIAVLPIDLNNNGKLDHDEQIYNNLDQLIKAIESGNAKRVPVDYVNISYPSVSNSSTNNLQLFVQYLLNDGQRHAHEYGFIDLESAELLRQKELTELSFKTTKSTLELE